jgi:hypothetical protein
MGPFRKYLDRLRAQNEDMRRRLSGELSAGPVTRSAWSTLEHLDHTIRVASGLLHVLNKEEIPRLPRGISVIGRLVLLTGWIPRGRGKSPERMLPAPATVDDLQRRLSEMDGQIERVANRTAAVPAFPIVRHPVFGGLTYGQALRFIAIHTHHHLKILDDARRAAVKRA